MMLKKQKIKIFTCLILVLFCIGICNLPFFNKHDSLMAQESCNVSYPIVMSHHWGMMKICEAEGDDLPSDECDTRAPERYCTDWRWKWFKKRCYNWEVPSEELDLPPRNTNAYDSTLSRNLNKYYRYYSKEIKDRMEQCGNKVYLSDKPAFASLQDRARSLRNTVLKALNAPGETAEKVIIIGMSMGCQDARYMIANLDAYEGGPSMKTKVADVVCVVGEAQGAGYSSLGLDAMYTDLYDWGLGTADWGNFNDNGAWQDKKAFVMDAAWKDSLGRPVLMEGDAPITSDVEETLYKHTLKSLINLSVKYMSGVGMMQEEFDFNDPYHWEVLCSYTGMSERFWSDVVSPADENNNGINYYSYGAKIRNWNFEDWGSSLSEEYLLFMTMYSCCGDNDGYVTVASQNMQGSLGYSNFLHVQTLAGHWLGRGYHHMFFAGRNDETLASAPAYREAYPYDGGSADFYKQVLKNLNNPDL